MLQWFAVYIALNRLGMTPFAQAVHKANLDLEFLPLASVTHLSHGFAFEFYVCRLTGSGQYRVYVARDGESCEYIFDPTHDVRCEENSAAEGGIVQDLVDVAMQDVDDNLQGVY